MKLKSEENTKTSEHKKIVSLENEKKESSPTVPDSIGGDTGDAR